MYSAVADRLSIRDSAHSARLQPARLAVPISGFASLMESAAQVSWEESSIFTSWECWKVSFQSAPTDVLGVFYFFNFFSVCDISPCYF